MCGTRPKHWAAAIAARVWSGWCPDYAVLIELSSTRNRSAGVDLENLLVEWLGQQVERGRLNDAVLDKPDEF